jgi:hypothetical protein
MPFTSGFLDYETVPGKVKHFYGFTFALGGIVSMNAGDFESINGFPNLWAWGFEDNSLYKRAVAKNFVVDRTQFYPFMDKNILQLQDGLTRTVNKTEYDVFRSDNGEGIASINRLQYDLDVNTGFVNVRQFNTEREINQTTSSKFDITKGGIPFPGSKRRGKSMGMFM